MTLKYRVANGRKFPLRARRRVAQASFEPLTDRAELNLTAEDNRRDRGGQAIHRRPEQRENVLPMVRATQRARLSRLRSNAIAELAA